MLVMFLFFSTRNLRAPSADRRQTLPHDRKLTQNNKLGLKIRGPLPPKNWGPKTCEISASFGPLQTLISNISGSTQDIQNRKAK